MSFSPVSFSSNAISPSPIPFSQKPLSFLESAISNLTKNFHPTPSSTEQDKLQRAIKTVVTHADKLTPSHLGFIINLYRYAVFFNQTNEADTLKEKLFTLATAHPELLEKIEEAAIKENLPILSTQPSIQPIQSTSSIEPEKTAISGIPASIAATTTTLMTKASELTTRGVKILEPTGQWIKSTAGNIRDIANNALSSVAEAYEKLAWPKFIGEDGKSLILNTLAIGAIAGFTNMVDGTIPHATAYTSTTLFAGALGVSSWFVSKKLNLDNFLALAILGAMGGVVGLGGVALRAHMGVNALCYFEGKHPTLYPKGSWLYDINAIKHDEITNFALMTPVALAAGNLVYKLFNREDVRRQLVAKDVERDGTTLTKWAQLKHEWKCLSSRRVIQSTVLLGSAVSINLLMKQFLPTLAFLPKGFDPSGHVITKIATTHGLGTALNSIHMSGQKHFALAAGLVAVAADTIMLGNTTACRHTVMDSLTGIAIGFGMTKVVNSVFNFVARRYYTILLDPRRPEYGMQ